MEVISIIKVKKTNSVELVFILLVMFRQSLHHGVVVVVGVGVGGVTAGSEGVGSGFLSM